MTRMDMTLSLPAVHYSAFVLTPDKRRVTLSLPAVHYLPYYFRKCFGAYKTVRQALITSCYKKLIDSLAKLLTFYHVFV